MNMIKKAAVLATLTGCLGAAGAGVASASGAEGAAVGSPGVLSGNVVQVPITIPINICGNSINILALLNPSGGTVCVNAEERGRNVRGFGHERFGRGGGGGRESFGGGGGGRGRENFGRGDEGRGRGDNGRGDEGRGRGNDRDDF
ncbi:chaplin [Peterkaempfera griseoplana]|uniref:chaplin n=1 Tax=Peterkaempfera griseoplana TaxID=66896 RepID=UPI0007C820CE|nr:chaplin [Peterkaempfera griseoplana]